jgi:hypothetical protein
MKFQVAGNSNNTVEFTTFIDDNGDFNVAVNGVKVLFIEKGKGRLFTRFIEEDDAANLKETGFELHDYGLIVNP